MAITELACLHLRNNQPIDSPENEAARTNLLSAIKAQAEYATYPVYLLTEVEDSSYIYLLGGWESVETHMQQWIPSQTNQRMLSRIQGDVEVVWLLHVDLDQQQQSLSSQQWEDIPPWLTAPVIAIGRYFVQGSQKGAFQDRFCAHKHHLEAFVAPKRIDGGWRLDSERSEEEEEFVLFSGWDAVEDHLSFAETDGFKDFAKFKEFFAGTEIKHAVRWAASKDTDFKR